MPKSNSFQNKRAGQREREDQFLDVSGYHLIFPGNYPIAYISNEQFREQLLRSVAGHVFLNEKNEFIDAGANVGITTAIIQGAATMETFGFLIEPSKIYLKYLAINAQEFRNCQIIEKYISPNFPIKPINCELFHWGGTAHLIDSKESVLRIDQQVDLLEYVSEKTALIKLDCDYSDLSILENIAPRLGQSRPLILFECVIRNDNDLNQIIRIISEMITQDYTRCLITHNEGYLIYSGNLTNSLYLILNFQLNLRKSSSEDKFYYSDILLIPESRSELLDLISRDLIGWQNIKVPGQNT